MVWPTLPAFSASNFLDHFTGSSLDATKWTALTAGTGAITVTDSYCDLNMPANTDAALIYAQQGMPTSKSQLWVWCFSRQSDGGNDMFYVVQGTPALGTQATQNPNVRITGFISGASPNQMRLFYYDSSHTKHFWTGSAWSTAGSNAGALVRDNDYYLLGLEVDAANARWRMLAWCNAYTTTGTFQVNQGLKLTVLTDWVLWSAMEATSNLYPCFGRLYTDIGTAAMESRYEWVRYAELTGTKPIEAWCDHKASLAATENIGHYWSYDGQLFVPETRANVALDVTASAWDSNSVMEPYVVYDGASTDYMFYQGSSDGSTFKIGVAKATHQATATQNGPWTKGASNPILNVSGTAESILYSPFVVCDQAETDASKRWKLLYAARSSVDSHVRIYGATAPDPPDTSTWTRQGLVLDLGASGSLDETYAENPFAIRRNGQWEVWYNGRDAANVCHTLRATGPTLFSQTKDGHGTYRDGRTGAATALTATPTDPGRTLNVSDTTGFVADGRVSLEVDGTNDEFAVSRVRKIVTAGAPGVLELYHGVTGFTTTYPSPIEQADHSVTFNHRTIVQVGGTAWWFFYEVWKYWQDHSPSFSSLEQDLHLATVSNADPTAAAITWQQLPGNVIPLSDLGNDAEVARAITLFMPPFTADTFAQALTLTQATNPALGKAAAKPLALAQAQAVSLLRGAGKVFAPTQSTAPTVGRGVGKPLAASQPHQPTLTKQTAKSLSASQATAPMLTNLKSKLLNLSVVQATAAGIGKGVALARALTQATQPALTKAVALPLSAAQATLAALSAVKQAGGTTINLTVLQPTQAGLTKAATLVRAVQQATSPALAKATGRTLAAVQGSLATLQALPVKLVALVAVQPTVAQLGRATTKALAASQGNIAGIGKQIGKGIAAAQPLAALLSAVRQGPGAITGKIFTLPARLRAWTLPKR